MSDHNRPISTQPVRIWTIGHSTRTAAEFEKLVGAHHVQTIVDVRSYPVSRRFPHFSQSHLSENLAQAGVSYCHIPSLGGMRKPLPNSKNTAWKNASFRGYADHMETEIFDEGISELLRVAANSRTAFMCAESLWWKCHRSLIADCLKSKGHEVIHILTVDKTEVHPYTSAARIVEGELSYAGLLPGDS
jgi:uncharacterized protein (DUF488 family)